MLTGSKIGYIVYMELDITMGLPLDGCNYELAGSIAR